jgi:hypothetical protein
VRREGSPRFFLGAWIAISISLKTTRIGRLLGFMEGRGIYVEVFPLQFDFHLSSPPVIKYAL